MVQPSLVFPYPGSSDTSYLQHTTQVQPQQYQSCVLRCLIGEISAMSALVTKICSLSPSPKRCGGDTAYMTGDWKSPRSTLDPIIENRQVQTEVGLSASYPIIRGTTQRQNQTNISTLEASLLKRLSSLPDRCDNDLEQENSLEPLK